MRFFTAPKVAQFAAELVVQFAAESVAQFTAESVAQFEWNIHNADFEVKVVHVHADLNVKKVESLPLICGEWQFVEFAPDFTIRYVSSHPDFTIRYVDVFPGTP